MKIGIDIDGVLANFNKSYANLLINEAGGLRGLPKNWETHPHFPPCWDWDEHYEFHGDIQKKVWTRIWNSKKFWRELDPLPGAREALFELNRRSMIGSHDIYFLTHRTGKRCKRQTEEWLYENGVDYPTVMLVQDKTTMCRILEIDAFIDDKLSTVNDLARISFEMDLKLRGKVYVKDAPYNRDNRHNEVKSVPSILDFVKAEGIWREGVL